VGFRYQVGLGRFADDDKDAEHLPMRASTEAAAGCLIICVAAFVCSLILFGLSMIAGAGWQAGTLIFK
jgi:hypothetical protein